MELVMFSAGTCDAKGVNVLDPLVIEIQGRRFERSLEKALRFGKDVVIEW
jgi:hypothetical protein